MLRKNGSPNLKRVRSGRKRDTESEPVPVGLVRAGDAVDATFHVTGFPGLSRKEILHLARRAAEHFLMRLLDIAHSADPADPPLRRMLFTLVADTGDLVRFLEQVEEHVPSPGPARLDERGSVRILRRHFNPSGNRSARDLAERGEVLHLAEAWARELSWFFALLSDQGTRENIVPFLRRVARSVDSGFDSAAADVLEQKGSL